MITFKQTMKKPFRSFASEQKVYYRANNKSGRGIATAFTADEFVDGKITLFVRNTDTGSCEKVGTYNNMGEVIIAANTIAIERDFDFVV